MKGEVGSLPNCSKQERPRIVTHSLSVASLTVCHNFMPFSLTVAWSSPCAAPSPAPACPPLALAVCPLVVAPLEPGAAAAAVLCRLARGASTSTPCAANMLISRFDMANSCLTVCLFPLAFAALRRRRGEL